jgi:hypothetical protein
LFEPHHYLKLPRMVGAAYYVGTVDGELAVYLAVSSMNKGKSVEARACRLVTMPEWQGAGVGFRFLNYICELQEHGSEYARLAGRKTTTLFHTSHPQLCQALRRDKRWRQLSGAMVGTNKKKSGASIRKAQSAKGNAMIGAGGGYGGHFRAVQGFRYGGQKWLNAP